MDITKPKEEKPKEKEQTTSPVDRRMTQVDPDRAKAFIKGFKGAF